MGESSFQNDNNITYLFLNWEQLGELTQSLATQILASRQEPFDRIIALATGGHTMSKALKDYLKIPRSSSLHISFYTGIGQTAPTPIISQSLATDVQNERVLVYDDVNDSGRTLDVVAGYLAMRGVREVVTATLFSKPTSIHPSDYTGQSTTSWIIFPDEVRETITALQARWTTQSLTPEMIRTRLLQIGFTPAHLQLVESYP